MFGWRGRVGLILPADNVVMEPELSSLGIDGVSFHGLRITSTDPPTMRQQALDLADAARELGLDCLVYACAETSFDLPTGERLRLSDLIGARAGVPVVTATEAMLSLLHDVGARNLTVVTPYREGAGRAFEELLVSGGFGVVAAVHRDFQLEGDDPRQWYATNRQDATGVYRMAVEATSPSADTLVIAATNLPTLSVVEALERDTGLDVVTSNQSILRWCFRSLGIAPAGLGVGDTLWKDAPR